MAQAGAVVHVVAAKTGTHELLEQVSLFVTALGAAEAGKGLFAVGVAQALELAGGQFERFLTGKSFRWACCFDKRTTFVRNPTSFSTDWLLMGYPKK
jgi:hypothetical protein